MHYLRSMSPALFLSIFIHSIILFMLLVTIAHQAYTKKLLRPQPQSLKMRQPQQQSFTPQTPAAQPVKIAQQPLPAQPQTDDVITPTTPASSQASNPQQHHVSPAVRSQEVAAPRIDKESITRTTAISPEHISPEHKNDDKVNQEQPSQSTSSSRRPRHAWHKYHTNNNTPRPQQTGSRQPTLNQLLQAGVDAVRAPTPSTSESENAKVERAIAESFLKDALKAYQQEIARALLYSLNRQRIVAAPNNQPPRIVFSITLAQNGTIRNAALVDALIDNPDMQKFVDEVIMAIRYAGPIRPFPSQIPDPEVTLTFTIIQLGPKNNPHTDHIPVVSTFRLVQDM